MGLEEVAVDLLPETDFAETSVEESTDQPSESEESKEPEKENEEQKEAAPEGAKPPVEEKAVSREQDEAIEKLKKDMAAIAYNLRESNRQQKFLEEQLRQERSKLQQKDIKDGFALELSKIDHLKDVDPEAYVREHTRLVENKAKKELESERESIKANETIAQAMARRQRVEERLHADFPDIIRQDSELFVESRRILEERYSPDETAYLLNNNPQAFYGVVNEANMNLRIKKLESEKAEKSREARVQSQGVVQATKKPSGDAVSSLSKEQLAFCKKNDLDPKAYARFVGKGR